MGVLGVGLVDDTFVVHLYPPHWLWHAVQHDVLGFVEVAGSAPGAARRWDREGRLAAPKPKDMHTRQNRIVAIGTRSSTGTRIMR